MSDEKEPKLHCYGCGAELQNVDPALTGYIPRKVLKDDGQLLCQRCFRLQHYGEKKEVTPITSDYKKICETIKNQKCLLVYVTDLFAFESSLIRPMHPYIKNIPVLVVANKRDVLPREVDDNKLKQFVYERLKEEGVRPKGIIISSAYKNYNIDEIIEAIKALRNGKNVYIVGAVSVGKSSIINSLLKIYKNETKNFITTSAYPGTTLDVINVPLDKDTQLFDTPGVMIESSIFAHVETNILKFIYPRREIKPRTFQLLPNQSIFIGGIARLDFVSGNRSGFTFYISNEVELHRTKLERADEIFNILVQEKKLRPCSVNITNMNQLQMYEFDLPEGKPIDLMISGYCWVKTKGTGQKIRIFVPRGVEVSLRNCKI